MAFELDYKALMRALERDLIYTLTILPTDVAAFKKNLSQAKVRMAVDGKLTYIVSEVVLPDKVLAEVEIVLVPKTKKAIQAFSVNPRKGSFEL